MASLCSVLQRGAREDLGPRGVQMEDGSRPHTHVCALSPSSLPSPTPPASFSSVVTVPSSRRKEEDEAETKVPQSVPQQIWGEPDYSEPERKPILTVNFSALFRGGRRTVTCDVDRSVVTLAS